MNKFMILGAGGQLGMELANLYPNSVRVFHFPSELGQSVDLSDYTSLSETIEREEPDILINAAALANVDMCEKNHALAYAVNGKAPGIMAHVCNNLGAKFVHVSTDYVFDGNEGNYSEASVPNPINYYGLSKLVGDVHALSYPDSLVVRTSGVFGYNKNFPMFVLDALNAGKEVNAMAGHYSPIHASNLASAISELVVMEEKGLINVAGSRTSRYDLAVKIADAFSLERSLISKVDKVASMNAKRPFDSSLNSSKALSMIKTDFYSLDSNISAMKRTLHSKME